MKTEATEIERLEAENAALKFENTKLRQAIEMALGQLAVSDCDYTHLRVLSDAIAAEEKQEQNQANLMSAEASEGKGRRL